MLQKVDEDRLVAVLTAIKRSNIRFPKTVIAKELGISKGMVSDYINGNKPISDNFYSKVIELLQDKITENKSDKYEKIAALSAGLKIITLEVMQLRSRVTGESIALIQLEYERLIEAATE